MSLIVASSSISSAPQLDMREDFLENRNLYNYVKNHDFSEEHMHKKELYCLKNDSSSDLDSGGLLHTPEDFLENGNLYKYVNNHNFSGEHMHEKDLYSLKNDGSSDLDSGGSENKLNCDTSFQHGNSPLGKYLPSKTTSDSSPDNSIYYVRRRTTFTKGQLMALEDIFSKEMYISKSRRSEISKLLNLPQNTVMVWFQNRRMKLKRQGLEISKSPKFPLESMKIPPYQPFVHPAPVSFHRNLYPSLCQPVSYSISPAYYYQTCVPYIASDINNGNYQISSPVEQLHCDRYITQESAAISDISSLQALKDHVISCCRTCSQACMTQTNDISWNTNTRDTSYEPHGQNSNNSTHYEGLVPCQNSNMSQRSIAQLVSLEHVPRQSMKPNSSSTKNNNSKSDSGKFFRPFEN